MLHSNKHLAGATGVGCFRMSRHERAGERHFSVNNKTSGLRALAPSCGCESSKMLHTIGQLQRCLTRWGLGVHVKWCAYSSPPGHPCSIAHLSTSSCTPSTALLTHLLIPRAVVLSRPPQNVQVLARSSVMHTFARPKCSSDPAPTATGARPQRPTYTSSHSTDSRAPSLTSAPETDRR